MFLVKAFCFIYTAHENSKLFKRIANVGTQSIVETECKKNGLWYELQGDYYIPCLKLSEEEQQPVVLWGQRHLRYIKQNRKVLYLNLLTSGSLNGYLADLDKQTEEMFFRLVKQMAKREGVTEQLKANNQPDSFYNILPEKYDLQIVTIILGKCVCKVECTDF